MMKRMFMLFAVLAAAASAGCTDQMAAKRLGGSAEIDLPPCRKLINVTWKEESLWYLTRAMQSADAVESYVFKESSSFGVWEGTVTLKESRDTTCK
jgi:hypothetical protein